MTYSEFRNQFPSVDGFMYAYGQLSFEEARAMINAEKSSPSIKACMITKWREARRKVLLRDVSVRLSDSGEMSIVFYEDESEFDGNDFEYRYSLDARNGNAFLQMIPHVWADKKTNIEEWLVENVHCDRIGGDLQEKWVRMGLHGIRVVWEDYPGGIYREEKF